jgi:hypothetical protein
MRGLPRDVDELLRLYGATIEKAAACDVWRTWQIAHHLWYRGVLRTFRRPEIITRDQAIAYLGITLSTWSNTIRWRWEALSVPVEGSHSLSSSRYRFSDVDLLLESRELVFIRAAKKGFLKSVIPGLDVFIVAETKKLVEELEQGFVFDVPLHLPQTPTQLEARYAGKLAKIIGYRLKYGTTLEDAISDNWTKIFGGNIVMKFMRSAAKRLPAQLDTEEVLDFLGIDWPEWQAMMATYDKAPNPVKGASTTLDAVYRSDDIRVLDESGYFKERGVRVLPSACVTEVNFARYFQRIVENNLRNLFRTLDRKSNKEIVLNDGACIQDNQRVRTLRRDDADLAWEDTLASEAISAESLVDIKRRAKEQEQQQSQLA